MLGARPFFYSTDWLQLGLLCGAGFLAWTLNTLSAGGGLLLIPAVTFLTGGRDIDAARPRWSMSPSYPLPL